MWKNQNTYISQWRWNFVLCICWMVAFILIVEIKIQIDFVIGIRIGIDIRMDDDDGPILNRSFTKFNWHLTNNNRIKTHLLLSLTFNKNRRATTFPQLVAFWVFVRWQKAHIIFVAFLPAARINNLQFAMIITQRFEIKMLIFLMFFTRDKLHQTTSAITHQSNSANELKKMSI